MKGCRMTPTGGGYPVPRATAVHCLGCRLSATSATSAVFLARLTVAPDRPPRETDASPRTASPAHAILYRTNRSLVSVQELSLSCPARPWRTASPRASPRA
eukprot:6698496-Pyramimonas_sp.AAC.1